MPGTKGARKGRGVDMDAAVIRYARTHPQMGQAKVAAALHGQGIEVSASGVRYLWRKHGLETAYKRLKALDGVPGRRALTVPQRAILQRGEARRRFAGKSRQASDGASQESGARRRLILDAAAELFVERGYAGTSMRAIAARVGMLAGSVYHHYPAKQSLYLAVQKEGFRQIVLRVEAAVSTSVDPWERLEIACAEHVASVVAGNAVARVTATGLFAVHEAALQRRLKRDHDRYEGVFRRLIAALDLPDDVDRSLLRLALLGALNWTLVWYRPGRRKPRDIARELVSMLRPTRT